MEHSLKKIYIFLILISILIIPVIAQAKSLNGYILLQVEKNGEAWYVNPINGQRYFLNRPADAFKIMQELALGVEHDYLVKTEFFPANLSGRILLDVHDSGKAYYIYPANNKKYYLGRPANAFSIMSSLGLGISDLNLNKIPLNGSKEKIILAAPFTSQAPFGNWQDQRQQDGCEEASVLMAIKLALSEDLSQEEALKEITASSDYILNKYGEYRDVGLNDVFNWLIKDYFDYQKATIKNNVSLTDLIDFIKQGSVIIAPMNGQLLKNPNFTAPGPINHMLLIIGYNNLTKKFITNDPGTRNGKYYEYDEKILFSALRTYPTGYHEPNNTPEKSVITIQR